jgi:hypothetical protein
MVSRPNLAAVDRDALSVGALRGAITALLVTGMIGGVALALALIWPWLAWGYVGVALTLAAALQLVASRVERSLEREIETVRRQHRSL